MVTGDTSNFTKHRLLHSFASTECRGPMALTSPYTESIHGILLRVLMY